MVNDTISDLLTKIRNANNVKHYLVQVPSTKITKSIAKILKDEGFIETYQLFKKTILIILKYTGKNKQPVISELKRISKPGLRVYSHTKNIPLVPRNLGILILSTSEGLMTSTNAQMKKIGGEILLEVY
jgi:small subunit ribosomal protein S8